jgi:ribonuclease HI
MINETKRLVPSPKSAKSPQIQVQIYTDGSCHTQLRVGGWAAIILVGEEKKILTGKETDTTHNRMEILAVIRAIEFIRDHYKEVDAIKVFSDSQYVVGLTTRKEKLVGQGFNTRSGKEIQNIDLVKELLSLTETLPMEWMKVKAHQKKNELINYNLEVDRLSRKIVRENLER